MGEKTKQNKTKQKNPSCTILQAPHESADPVGHQEVNPVRYSCGQIVAMLFPGALIGIALNINSVLSKKRAL